MTRDIEYLFRRLAARGYFEITPAEMVVRRWTSGTTEFQDYGPAVGIAWAPHGQGGSGGDHRFNPFATRTTVAPTLREALEAMVDATTPRWDTIEGIAWRRRVERDQGVLIGTTR